MKKKIVLALVAAACLGLVAACQTETKEKGGGVYTVTFDSNAGQITLSGTLDETSRTVKKGEALGSLPTLRSTSHYVTGWNRAADGIGAMVNSSTPVNESFTAYAQWALKTSYSVTFDYDGGTPGPSSIEVTRGQSAGDDWPQNPTKPPQAFGGWFAAADSTGTGTLYTKDTTVSGDLNLKARWVANNTATVTFRINHTDTEGALPTGDQVGLTATGTYYSALPTATRTEGWGAGMMFDGWYTEATGGTKINPGEEIPASGAHTELFAHWKYEPGTAVLGTSRVLGSGSNATLGASPIEAVIVIAPASERVSGSGFGTWHSDNVDNIATAGTVTISGNAAQYSGGGLGFAFPTFPPGQNIEDYDFVDVYYLNRTSSSDGMSVTSKHYSDGSIDLIPTNKSEYLGTQSSDILRFALKVAGYDDGVALSRRGPARAPGPGGDGTLKFTKAVFYKGERHTITFDAGADGYTAPAIPSIQAVAGAAIGALPIPERPGYNFGGWLNGTNLVSATTIMVNRNLALRAKWDVPQRVENIDVTFSNNPTPSGGGSVSENTGTGFTFTYGSGDNTNYGNAYASFRITLPTNAKLSDYDQITLTWKGEAGDIDDKDVVLKVLANATGFIADNAREGTDTFRVTGTTDTSVTLNIKKTDDLTTRATGEVILAFYIHADNVSGGSRTSYTISDVTFTQN